jgi:hypothetical protein
LAGSGRNARLIECDEAPATRAFELLEWPVVELLEQRRDRRVELAEREERAITKPREDPPLHDEHARFDLRLVARLAHASRQDRDVVVRGEVVVARVELRLVAMRTLHGAAQVVRDERAGHAADVLQRSHVRAQPVGKLLAERGFRVRVVRAAEHRDEDLRLALLAGVPIRDRHALPSVVDEELVAGLVHLA